MSVRNRTRGSLLAKTLLTLNAHFVKTLRHLNSTGIPLDCALWITPCQAIYTVGMKEPVDIVFLSKEGRVVKMYRSFPPNCLAEASPGAVSALELPSNTLSESKTRTGDLIEIDPS